MIDLKESMKLNISKNSLHYKLVMRYIGWRGVETNSFCSYIRNIIMALFLMVTYSSFVGWVIFCFLLTIVIIFSGISIPALSNLYYTATIVSFMFLTIGSFIAIDIAIDKYKEYAREKKRKELELAGYMETKGIIEKRPTSFWKLTKAWFKARHGNFCPSVNFID